MSVALPLVFLACGLFFLRLHARRKPTDRLAAQASDARVLITGIVLVIAAVAAVVVDVLDG